VTYVTTYEEIERNAFALLDAAHGAGAERNAALKLIKGSFVYFPLEYEGQLAFVPSKFIGYPDNSVARHEALKRVEGRDGRKTNVAVDKILGKSFADEDLDSRLHEYCSALGLEVENKKHRFWRIQAAKRFTAPQASAINDIADPSQGNDDPEYRKRMAGVYVRDPLVRRDVLDRANGRCEFCGQPGFVNRHGRPYLETHHVISLAEQGVDRVTNVIALCPNDHRRAHFGSDWEELQSDFLQKLKDLYA
jgi:hypothetical protein